ncbi:uncharacterized protein ANIA_10696 [Aspergillus nidulans FGSC A4]|uniref:Uncharacterized protein n=1 Tax=Emericella nidulans (strain FGSC A4 / ATCC 38163 / CBS 112.46 / NRRL 194 / M139) TaxID=227321 RepID=C8VG46_EMENI|nr:hypothetical protein [Aspergillus nidulans FGSC A4]CBF81662.1 TPA: hypothetical protein ANIA_10696 [Aspergillus nidulans FGSC A4]
MASSPDSTHSFSDMDAGSRTPTQQIQTTSPQFAGASELSPPGSQTQPAGGIANITQGISGTEEGTEESQHPGASWMNKRAEEEYQRAMEYVIDLDWNLDEFGDPFDERDMKEKLG